MADSSNTQQASGPMRRPRRGEVVEEKQFDERTLHIDRVARVVKGGRRFRFRALVAIGDHKGKVGIGTAKGADVTAAVTKATEVAKKNMIKVATYKDTIPHEVEAKVGGILPVVRYISCFHRFLSISFTSGMPFAGWLKQGKSFNGGVSRISLVS